ncbi:MAG: hypothetical protein AB7V43_19475 [Acidimicrobiia bacterium]
MQSTTTRIGLGVAGTVTFALSFAPLASAVDNETEDATPAVTMQQPVPFLDLLYAAPHEGLHLGDDTTIVIAQTLPATYSLVSYMSTGAKCIAPYDAPAAESTKTGTETDADKITRTIVASGTDTDDNGIDDHYEGTYDENGIAACKIKVTDEHGNMDWKYIYINVGLPKPTKTPTGNDFDTGATTIAPPTTVAKAVSATTAATTTAPSTTAAPTASVAGNSVTAGSTLPRTGTTPWVQVGLGALLAAAGASMVMMSRRRSGPREGHVFEF